MIQETKINITEVLNMYSNYLQWKFRYTTHTFLSLLTLAIVAFLYSGCVDVIIPEEMKDSSGVESSTSSDSIPDFVSLGYLTKRSTSYTSDHSVSKILDSIYNEVGLLVKSIEWVHQAAYRDDPAVDRYDTTYYEYNENFLIQRSQIFNGDDTTGEPTRNSEYTYNTNNLLLTKSLYVQSQEVPVDHFVYEYDSENRLIEEREYDDDDGSSLSFESKKYRYLNNSVEREELEGGKLYWCNLQKLDSLGRVYEIYYGCAVREQVLLSYKYTYDETTGLLTTVDHYNGTVVDGANPLDSRTEYIYQNNRLTKIETRNVTDWSITGLKNYEYNAVGLLIRYTIDNTYEYVYEYF